MARIIYPSELRTTDEWQGSKVHLLRERQLREMARIRHSSNQHAFVYSGMGISNPSGIKATVAAGTAWVGGHVCVLSASQNTADLSAGTWNIWLNLTFDSSNRVTDFTIDGTTTLTEDRGMYSCLLGQVVSNGSTGLTSMQSSSKRPGVTGYEYSGTTGTRFIFLGWKPVWVLIVGKTTSEAYWAFTVRDIGPDTLGIRGTTPAGHITIGQWGITIDGAMNTSGKNYVAWCFAGKS